MFGAPAWLLIFPVLLFLVFVHELGHFVTAKLFGIKVTEFGFGFPPRIFGIRRGETVYSVNWLPLGGFVKMVGEEDPTEPRSFARQPPGKRAVVLVAGSFMNLVVPVVIFTVLLMLPHDTLVGGNVMIGTVAPGSPAQEAGLRAGDTILQVNGENVSSPGELVDRVKSSLDVPTELTVRRGAMISGLGSSPEFAVNEVVTLVPRAEPPRYRVVEQVADPATEVSAADARRYDLDLEVGDTMVQGPVGVTIGLVNPRIESTTDPIWAAVPRSFTTIWDVLVFTKNGLSEGLSTGTNPGLAGPVGIAQATGEIVDELGIMWVLQLTALLSISLGIINILPIPALDGGRLTFVVLEWVRGGKRVSPKREGLVHLVGFVLIIGLVLMISYYDVIRLLNGESILP